MCNLIIKFRVKSSFYKIKHSNDEESEVKKINQELVNALYNSMDSRDKTSYIPNEYIPLGNNDPRLIFMNEKFKLIKIIKEEFEYTNGYLNVKYTLDINTKVNSFSQEDIESLIYDSFNETYSTDKDFVDIDEYCQTIGRSNWYDFMLKIIDTPENIEWITV